MKIKTKKQLNLPQLIEWAWDNPDLSHGMTFISNGCERVKIEFRYNPRGVLNLDILNGTSISNNIQFTLEEFEEITEDKWFSELVIRTVAGDYILYKQGSINDFKHLAFNDVEAIYIPNDDLTMTLIWHDGKLIEE
ncbi:hypothetical protein [Staphylococcus arlettae]|uniref:hypothetical protein n=1 Tax=Staphylococcus arlettae TaxID=29378 RepID=UPI0021D0E90F|nr:hypothetical protein [Staphylococcus arlettae]UXU53190.1 hypothetical protein MUA71_03690 [Staphylococcus arlettae]